MAPDGIALKQKFAMAAYHLLLERSKNGGISEGGDNSRIFQIDINVKLKVINGVVPTVIAITIFFGTGLPTFAKPRR